VAGSGIRDDGGEAAISKRVESICLVSCTASHIELIMGATDAPMGCSHSNTEFGLVLSTQGIVSRSSVYRWTIYLNVLQPSWLKSSVLMGVFDKAVRAAHRAATRFKGSHQIC
jgi:hypothetical protein